MKGDIIIVEQHHVSAAQKIAAHILPRIQNEKKRYVITVSGESGSGKSETAKALSDALGESNITCAVLAQDDYFILPPKQNDKKRRQDDAWLGPHAEVDMSLLNLHILEFLNGADKISKPLVDYDNDSVSREVVGLEGVKVLIAEGTYTALLRHVDCRVFINRNRLDTLEHRKKRNRGNEANDPFIEDVLKTEHKIIAGHRFLADVVITKDYQVEINP